MKQGIYRALSISLICAASLRCAQDEGTAHVGNGNEPGIVAGEGPGGGAGLGPQAGSSPNPGTRDGATPDASVSSDAAGEPQPDSASPGIQPVPDGAAVPDAASAAAPDAAPDAAPLPDTGAPAACPALGAYALQTEIVLNDIPREASGIAYNQDSNSFFIAANLQGRLWEYDKGLETRLRTISLSDMDTDTEGLAYLGDGWLAIAVESNYIYVARIDPSTTSISGSSSEVQVYQPSGPPPVRNAGFEGVAFRRPRNGSPGRIFTCQEYMPMRVLGFDHSADLPPFVQKSYLDGTLLVQELWDAEQVLSAYVNDISGMAHDETNDTLLIVSQESSVVIRVDPLTGAVTETLSLPNTSTSEGIALFDRCRMAVVSEPNRVQIFAPNGS